MNARIVTLKDPNSDARAKILASFGFNCFELQLMHDEKPLDVIWSAANFESGNERASGSGNPILFPFPGRIMGTRFRWQGREFQLEEGDGRGNAIHGFVLNRPWRIIEQSESRVVGQFQASLDDAGLLEKWPADFRITATYQLRDNLLEMHYLLENPDTISLPCGFGIHPYFRVPLGGSDAMACQVKLPVQRRWELNEMLPTGEIQTLDNAAEFQNGLSFGEMNFDDVFTDLQFAGDRCLSSIHDPDGATLRIAFDRTFRECVVYNPPHREAICIEPYTFVAGAFDLPPEIDTGMRVLGPGESFAANVTIALE